MCRKLFLFIYLLFSLLAVLGAEQQYLITETQLQSIETLAQKWEQGRQNWELQAHALNQRLEGAEKQAETLNSQLRTEREQYRNLTESFNRYEVSQWEAMTVKETELKKTEAKLDTVKKQRNIFIFTTSLLLLIVAVFVFFKIRK